MLALRFLDFFDLLDVLFFCHTGPRPKRRIGHLLHILELVGGRRILNHRLVKLLADMLCVVFVWIQQADVLFDFLSEGFWTFLRELLQVLLEFFPVG